MKEKLEKLLAELEAEKADCRKQIKAKHVNSDGFTEQYYVLDSVISRIKEILK